jgi:uncharacterized coiled-coil DUF342 family protein
MSPDRTTEILNYLSAISREVGELRTELRELRTDVRELRDEVRAITSRLDSAKHVRQPIVDWRSFG